MDDPAPALELCSARLRLRQWRLSDRAPFAAMNADPTVMEHYPALLTREQSDAMVDRIDACFAEHGWGLWAVEVLASAEFAGYVGLWAPRFEAHFMPAVEVGWRLDHRYWEHGFATEAAAAVLDRAFGPLGLTQVVSMTSTRNLRSQRVMQKLGMRRDPAEDFDHPMVAAGHPLQRHVLYRITPGQWAARPV